VMEILRSDPSIEHVVDFKSNTIGLGTYRIKCEVEWNGAVLLRESSRTGTMRDEYDEVRNDFEAFKKFTADFADRIPRMMGKKIDEIEARIRSRYPGIKHIDIEAN
jgi:hypothetical protein